MGGVPVGQVSSYIPDAGLLWRRNIAIDYLRRCVGNDGRFIYQRRIWSERTSKEYNLIRHAGTAMAILQQDARSSAGLHALEYLLRFVAPGGGVACVIEDGEAKLGATGLGLLALLASCRRNNPVVAKMADYLVAQQGRDGRFASVKFFGAEPRTFDSIYYPGEAMLALVRAHKHANNILYLDAACLGADYLLRRYQSDPEEDHWLMLAVRELDEFAPDHQRRAGVVRLGELIASAAIVDDAGNYCYWDEDARLCPAATRAEALGAAVELACRSGRIDAARALATRLEQAVAFCTSCQIINNYASSDSTWAVGGFIASHSNPLIRIDFVQHAIGAIDAVLRARELLRQYASERDTQDEKTECEAS